METEVSDRIIELIQISQTARHGFEKAALPSVHLIQPLAKACEPIKVVVLGEGTRGVVSCLII